jgi:hypothetical protein
MTSTSPHQALPKNLEAIDPELADFAVGGKIVSGSTRRQKTEA